MYVYLMYCHNTCNIDIYIYVHIYGSLFVKKNRGAGQKLISKLLWLGSHPASGSVKYLSLIP